MRSFNYPLSPSYGGEGEGEGKMPAKISSLRTFAKHLRKNQTDTERKLWGHLRSRQLNGLKFRRQHPVGPYIVDFCCMEKKIVVELDGGQHLTQELADKRRTENINNLGYRVLRFWDHEVFMNTEAVLEQILEAVDDPHPNLLPSGRGCKSESF